MPDRASSRAGAAARLEAFWASRRDAGETVTRADRLRIVAALTPPVPRLLDVGCGDGTLARLLAGKVGRLVGVDSVPSAVALARENGVSAVLHDLNAGSLPYRDGSFNAATCVDVLAYLLDPPKVLEEIRRVLAPGGVLILTTPNLRYVPFLFALVVRGRFPRTSREEQVYRGGQLHPFTFGDVRALLVEAGYIGLEEFGFEPPAQPTRFRRGKDALKGLLGPRFKREFFSAGVVVRATTPRWRRMP